MISVNCGLPKRSAGYLEEEWPEDERGPKCVGIAEGVRSYEKNRERESKKKRKEQESQEPGMPPIGIVPAHREAVPDESCILEAVAQEFGREFRTIGQRALS